MHKSRTREKEGAGKIIKQTTEKTNI